MDQADIERGRAAVSASIERLAAHNADALAASASAAALTAADAARVARSLRGAFAPNTARAYVRNWQRFGAWCDGRGYPSLPATPESVAAYLQERAEDGAAPSTVKLAAASIAAAHKAAGLPNVCDAAPVRGAVKSIAEEPAYSDRGRGQARPVSADDVDAIIAAAIAEARQHERSAHYGRAYRCQQDAAIAGLLFQAGLRRSEVAALTWRDVQPASDGRGLLVRVRFGKTNRSGARVDVRYMKGAAARAVDALRPANALPSGERVLSQGRKGSAGLTSDSVGRRFAAAARRAGIEGVTAHSGRVGLASELTARGASGQEVMHAGGWSDFRMVKHYSAGAVAERGAVAKYL